MEEFDMKYGKSFYLKLAALFVLSLSLMWLDIGGVTNLRDFMTGFIMAICIILGLYLVYSLIRTLHEDRRDEDKKP